MGGLVGHTQKYSGIIRGSHEMTQCVGHRYCMGNIQDKCPSLLSLYYHCCPYIEIFIFHCVSQCGNNTRNIELKIVVQDLQTLNKWLFWEISG